MEPSGWFAVILAAMVIWTGVSAVRQLVQVARARRDHRHLAMAGRRATAVVIAVEPMDRSVNGASGHPVWLRFRDPEGGQHEIRDTTGLGGYLAREGSLVRIRYVPNHPVLHRVEEIVGADGPYPTRPGGPPREPSLAGPLRGAGGVALVGSFMFFALLSEGGRDFGFRVVPVIVGGGGLVLLVFAALSWIRLARVRRRLTGETIGTVTEVWPELIGGGGGVNRFTVHFVADDGREVHARCASASSRFRPRVSQRVGVRYDRAHPARFEVVELAHAGAGMVALPAAVGMIMLLLGVVLIANLLRG